MFSQIPLHITSKIRPNSVTACWEWIGARDGRGYADIEVQRRVRTAYPVLYEPVNGQAGRSGWLTMIAASGSPGSELPAPSVGKRAFPRASLSAATTAVQVRGVLAERVIVSTQLDPFLSLKALATYSGLSVRTLREYLTDSVNPLPHYRVGAKILVRRSEFDGWIVTYRQRGHPDVAQVVAAVLGTLNADRQPN